MNNLEFVQIPVSSLQSLLGKRKGGNNYNETLIHPTAKHVATGQMAASKQQFKKALKKKKTKKAPFTGKELTVKEIKKLFKPEVKYHIVLDNNQFTKSGVAFAGDLIKGISRGTQFDERIGDRIQVLAIDWILTITQATWEGATTASPVWYGICAEVAFWQIPSVNGATLTYANFYDSQNSGSGGVMYFPRKTSGIKFKCLEKSNVECDGIQGETNLRRNFLVIRGSNEVQYNADTGNSSDVQQGGLWYTLVQTNGCVSGSGGGYTSVNPEFFLRCRIKYIDC